MSDEEYDEYEYIYCKYSKAWESQQQLTFTAWCNAHLRKVDMKIDVFEQDFRNGLRLMKLLEIISSDALPPPDKGKMRFHKIANVSKALKFIEERGVKLASVGAEEIVDGNIKMTLGMIWTIILRFTIQDILVEDSSAKDGLLLWCKRKTNGYKDVRVDNFRNSFQNGLALCALIHSHNPDLIDYDTLSPKDARHNLNLAFTVADNNLDVPQMLNVEDMLANDNSDERSMMAYVSSYYHAFNKRDKIGAALGHISDTISARMKEDSCANHYDRMCSDLLLWIETATRQFEDLEDVNENSQIIARVKSFEQYKFLDKPNHTSLQMKIHFGSIENTVLKEKDAIIKSKWNNMERLESVYEAHLAEQGHRNDNIQNLLNKFEINFQVLRAWISNKIDQLISKDYESSSLCDLRRLSRLQETFAAVIGSQQSRTEKVVRIAEELRHLRYKDMETIDEKVDIIVSPWDTLGSLNEQRIQSINVYLTALLKVDDLQLEFAKRVMPLYNWIQQANQDLNDTFILRVVGEIKDLITAQKVFKKTVGEALGELSEIKSLDDQVCQIIKTIGIQKIPLNPYTEITMTDAQKAWVQLERSIPERDSFLNDSLARQTSMAQYHCEFRKKIENISSGLLDVQKNLFDSITSKLSKEKKKDVLNRLQEKLNDNDVAMGDLEVFYQKLDNHCKMDDSKTLLSFEQMVAKGDTLKQVISEQFRMNGCDHSDSSILKDVPRNNIQDYKACFRHFDKHDCGQLDLPQFRACLVSLGFELEDDSKKNGSFDQIVAAVDPASTGLVSLARFLDFMDRGNEQQCSKDTLLHSFKVLSNNQLWISRDTICRELPPPVADYCLRNMRQYVSCSGDHGDSGLDYGDFVARLSCGTSTVPPIPALDC